MSTKKRNNHTTAKSAWNAYKESCFSRSERHFPLTQSTSHTISMQKQKWQRRDCVYFSLSACMQMYDYRLHRTCHLCAWWIMTFPSASAQPHFPFVSNTPWKLISGKREKNAIFGRADLTLAARGKQESGSKGVENKTSPTQAPTTTTSRAIWHRGRFFSYVSRPRVSDRSRKQATPKSSIQHMTLVLRPRKSSEKKKRRVYIRKAKKSSFSGGLCTVARKFRQFSALVVCELALSSGSVCVHGTNTADRPYSHLFYSCFDSEIQENALYTQSDKMLYKFGTSTPASRYAACYFAFTSCRSMELCVQHTPKILSSLFIYCRNIEIIKKVLVVAWIWTFDSLLTIRFLNIWEWTVH